jgi:tetratricopeptide (TPR) repeat protein
MFLEKRVYQGSSGKVYPNAFTDCVSDTKVDQVYDAVFLENEYVRVMVLPEIGGRIHIGLDKTNNYDFFYRQRVIKPALVGLLGPWISGGVEFNWPQHHRPTTFQPVDFELVENEDGSKTVWLGEIEPMNRMKGMVGITLHPGTSLIEARVQLYNRTPLPQTFLWWANVAAHVHDQYQPVFPPDVTFVADHAKRAITSFPVARGIYYGVDYSPGTRIDWYKNIPVPTSYMVTKSDYNFFGGYDHARQAGFVHVANRHIAPGKKQWTWGNAEFGYAWDRNLTDEDGPYIELMAGVYTDNQPDFSWLQPHETKAFSQFWYPIRQIGPPKNANIHAALNLEVEAERIRVGAHSPSMRRGCTVLLTGGKTVLLERMVDLGPDSPFVAEVPTARGIEEADLSLRLLGPDGGEIIAYRPPRAEPEELPAPAKPVPWPREAKTNEDLYLAGLHLEQYRHATREPRPYYEEALRRDRSDARNNNALGRLLLRGGEFAEAAERFQRAIDTLTRWNPDPYDGEPFYNLGLARTYMRLHEAAYGAYYKATWNQAWASAGYCAVAELDCRHGRWLEALEHLEKSLATNRLDNKALWLRAAVLRRLGRLDEAETAAAGLKAYDPLDFGCRNELLIVRALCGEHEQSDRELDQFVALMRGEAHSYLDLAIDYGNAGLYDDAIGVLERFVRLQGNPMRIYPEIYYYLGSYSAQEGNAQAADRYYRLAAQMPPDYCFPSRLESLVALEDAIAHDPSDARAHYYLGNLLYDKRRYDKAIRHWETSRALDESFPTVHRNLGFAYYNVRRDVASARGSLDRAHALKPDDARILFELDQLLKLVGASPQERIELLEHNRSLVERRDDLYLEFVALQNLLGRYDQAVELLELRRFHPWEGGEGKVPEQYVLAHLLRGQARLGVRDVEGALADFIAALTYPPNLGEGKHLLTREANVFHALGTAHAAAGAEGKAREFYTRAVEEPNDWSEMSYYQALAHRKLGDEAGAQAMLRGLAEHAERQTDADVQIDYFATSLPSFLLFEDDLGLRNRVNRTYLLGLACLGLGRVEAARRHFETVLELDPNHMGATTFVRELDLSGDAGDRPSGQRVEEH